MPDESNAPEPDFEWVIAARADIQRALLDLYRFEEKIRSRLLVEADNVSKSAFALLVGASFSLWRAAFLSDIAQGWPQILDSAKLLLHEVLSSNAVPYLAPQSASAASSPFPARVGSTAASICSTA